MHPEIAHGFFNAVIGQIAIATMQLQAVIGHFATHICHQLFGHSAEMRCICCAIVQFPSGLSQKYARRLQLNLHIGQTKLQRLKLIY